MKVLFVYSTVNSFYERPLGHAALRTFRQFQFGISYIASAMRAEGMEPVLVVLRKDGDFLELDRAIREHGPSMACFTSVYSEFAPIARAAAHIKSLHPEIYLLAGGVHATLNPGEVIGKSFDAICIGEGEGAAIEAARALAAGRRPDSIPNLWIKRDGEVQKNPPRPYVPDLDCVVFPERTMWERWVQKPHRSFSVLLGRGCPFNCSYCCNHALRDVAEGKYVRFRSPENVVAEIGQILDRYPEADNIHLEVETITAKKSYLNEICLMLEKLRNNTGRNITFSTNVRLTPGIELDDAFSRLSRAGVNFISIGVESGSERVREQTLRRKYSNDDIRNAARAARANGIDLGFYNMIGLPGETYADHMETVAINRECQPKAAMHGIFFPYPGTDLYELAQREGLIRCNLSTAADRAVPVLDLPGFSSRQIKNAFILFPYRVYRGNRPLKWLIGVVLYHWTISIPPLNRALLWLKSLLKG